MTMYWNHYYLVFRAARAVFSLLERSLMNEKNPAKKNFKERYLRSFAAYDGFGHYSSWPLEKHFLEIAKNHTVELTTKYSPNTCLLVFSKPLVSGGHTRVAERWIETDSGRRYSIVFTRHDFEDVPPRLRNAVLNSGGDLLYLDKGLDEVLKGLQLREVASRFETVVLFTHMCDVVPLIAFGSETFKRPVGYYNHADHRFWLGVSIADVVGEIREWGAVLSRQYRGVLHQQMIGVPRDSSAIKHGDKVRARHELGLEDGAHVVTCVGRYEKMLPANGVSMLEVVNGILSKDPHCYFLMVGFVESQIEGWSEMAIKHNHRLRCFAAVPYQQLPQFLFAADIVLDSRPQGGITALEDALHCNRPILSCSSKLEWIVASSAHCTDNAEMVGKALCWLRLSSASLWKIALEQADVLEKYAGAECFRKNINSFLERLKGQPHRIREFAGRPTPFLDCDRLSVVRQEKTFYRDFFIKALLLLTSVRLYCKVKGVASP